MNQDEFEHILEQIRAELPQRLPEKQPPTLTAKLQALFAEMLHDEQAGKCETAHATHLSQNGTESKPLPGQAERGHDQGRTR